MANKSQDNSMIKSNMTVGQRIRYFRQKRGLTQKQLAEKCNVGDSTIRNYELDIRVPNEEIIQEIAIALKIDQYELSHPPAKDAFASLHYLFELEDIHGLKPTITDNKITLEIDESNPYHQSLRIAFIRWGFARKMYEEGRLLEDEYTEWREMFPLPYTPSEGHSKAAAELAAMDNEFNEFVNNKRELPKWLK